MIKEILQGYPIIAQFSRFVVVGFMNTAIDFLVLNLLMWWTGIYSGQWIILLNAIAFGTAVTNSYFWNKYWTFKAKATPISAKETSQFLIVSIIGVIINSGIVYGMTTFIPPFWGFAQQLSLGKELWANLAKAVATGISLIWNFLGYKFVVFKKR